MSEKLAYQTLKNNMSQHPDRIDRIENVLVPGMPDVNFCANGIEAWIEIKAPKEPRSNSTALFQSNHKISQEQANWMLRHIKSGGKCYIIISTEERWVLISGVYAIEINNMTISEIIEKASWWAKKPVRNKMEWKLLRERLINGNKQI